MDEPALYISETKPGLILLQNLVTPMMSLCLYLYEGSNSQEIICDVTHMVFHLVYRIFQPLNQSKPEIMLSYIRLNLPQIVLDFVSCLRWSL